MTITQADSPPRGPDAPGQARLWARGRRLALVVAGAWAVINAGALVRGLLPAPLGYPMPWGMFRTAATEYRTVGAYGVTPDGKRVAIPLDQHFRYARGATDLRVYDVPRVLVKADRQAQADLAGWLAARVARAGTELAYVAFYVEVHDIDTGVTRTVRLGQHRVDRAR